MVKASKNNNDLISIIIPAYNIEKYIERCINSILNQTYKNLEIIIIDDGSKDKTSKICDIIAKSEKRIHVYHNKNHGVSYSRNYGIKKATGEYIAFIDGDDTIEKTYIEELYNKITNYNVEYVACGYNRVYKKNSEAINNDLREYIINSHDYINMLLNVQKGYGFVYSKLIKRELIKDILFDEKLQVGEDALYNVMICKKNIKHLIYNKSLYNYYFNPNSVVRKYDTNYCEKYLLSMEKMSNYIKENYNNDIEILNNLYNYIAYHVMLICVNYCYHPLNKNKGIKLIKEVCQNKILREAITKSNYENLSISRKIALFALKHRLYLLMSLICQYRQLQFRKDSK